MITPAIRPRTVGRVENCADLASLEIFDDAWSRPFERYGENPLTKLEMLRVIGGGEPRERVDGGEARVSRRGCVAPVAFEMVKEREDRIRGEILKIKYDDRTTATFGEESQE